jgi:DNA (cytosine-5)-methyltransferase 1
LISIGSVYSGIAGLELGLLAAFNEAHVPARVAWQIEIDPFCQRVLACHFPHVQRFGDVATVKHPPKIDVLCGGFACQDVSSAGRGAGLGRRTRSGHTLFHLLRLIDEIAPPWVVIENVASGAKRWLPRVVQELRDRGYRPRAVPLGAIDVGAPHLRRRVFVVADRDDGDGDGAIRLHEREQPGRMAPWLAGSGQRGGADLADPTSARRSGSQDAGADRGDEGARHETGKWRSAGGLESERGDLLPDAERRELRHESGRSGWARGAGTGEPRDDGAELADASTVRWCEWKEGAGECCSGVVSGSEERAGSLRGHERSSQSGLGSGADGLSGDVAPYDVAGHRWPTGRGIPQEAWEPRRALPANVKTNERPAKLKALGNAVVPQCALVVGRILLALYQDPTRHATTTRSHATTLPTR